MASGPLVVIHPVLEEATAGATTPTTHPPPPTSPNPLLPSRKSPDVSTSSLVIRRIDDSDHFFYWNTPDGIALKQTTASSSWELSGPSGSVVVPSNNSNSNSAATDWLADSDPNLQKNLPPASSYFGTELTFNNCMCTNTGNHSTAAVAASAKHSPSATTTAPDWLLLPTTLNNEASVAARETDFFLHSFGGSGASTATTIVNNRGGFFESSGAGGGGVGGGNPFDSSGGGGGGGQGFQRNQVAQALLSSAGNGTGGSGGAGGSLSNSSSPSSSSKPTTAPVTVASRHRNPRRASSDVAGGLGDCDGGTTTPAVKDRSKSVRPSSDTNVISLTDNPGAPMLKTDSTMSLDTEARTRTCCFCWCCCCSCSCVRVRPSIEVSKRSTQSMDEPHRTETQLLEPRTTYEEIISWSESFDNLMRCFTSVDGSVGQRAFREFLRSEFSEENILFWLACEDLKQETDPASVEEKARLIYEDYISILSPKEVSLDSRVREMINTNMTQPTPHTFDEAQLQIYTLMQRDSYPRFLVSRIYKDLLNMTKGVDEAP